MKYAFLDLFCGAGGTSSGIENVPNAFVYACVNHDKNAILSHQSNHPGALHFTEDIRTVSIQKLIDKTNEVRAQYPGIKICLWASLECTNHSNAKGGMSRDADSRTLAEHLYRYFPIDFDLIFIENVKEFKEWGPLVYKMKDGVIVLDKKDKPVMIPDKQYRGVDYKKWINNVCATGYEYQDVIINCADIGCPTTRKRLFIQFVKPELTIGWPKQTHSKGGKDGFKEWLAVGPLLKLDEHGESVFTRKLAPNTYKRIHKGVKKFGVNPFISKYYGNGDNVSELTKPCPTLTTKDRCYLTSSFLLNNYINPSFTKLCEPCSVIVTKPQQKLITCFIMQENSDGRNYKITNPCPTLTTVPKEKIVTTHFLSSQYGKSIGSDMKDPAPTLTKIPKENVVSAHFLMDHQFNNEGNSLNEPCPTLIARMDKKPKYLVSAQFLMSTSFNNIGTDLKDPAPTQLASRKYDYLVTSDDSGTNRAIIQEGDGEELIALKMFMQENGISDIKMRPLYIVEMLKIMTFPDGYKLIGTKTEQKKYIGNAVPVEAAERIVEASMMLNAA